MANWADLETELARWQAVRQQPAFWWRDDDAHAATPALDPMLDLSDRYKVPLHLAVIPARLQPCLASRLAGSAPVLTLQHGFAHQNHEPKGKGASEFGVHRDKSAIRRDLQQGRQLLRNAGLPHLIPAFVPPWNRMSAVALRELAVLGFRAVSAYEGHTPQSPHPTMIRADGHIDPIRWKQGATFRGEAAMLEMITTHLSARRNGQSDAGTPIGYLTHHLVTGQDIWDFTARLFDRMAGKVRWVRLPSLFFEL
jgi:hypothetical protein